MFTLVIVSVPAVAGDAGLHLAALRQPAPELQLGAGRALSDFRGQWVLLHFWATWCAPCREELPALERFYRRDPGEFAFLTVAMDGHDREAVADFRSRLGITMPVVLEQDSGPAKIYTPWGLPVTYFIDPEGNIVARAMGVQDWEGVAAGALMEALARR